MTIMTLENLVIGPQAEPDRIFMYGVDGVGKSSFAANAPSPIFIATEKGTKHLNVARFPSPQTWDHIFDAIGTLYESEHQFKTLVLDSADWAEELAKASVCVEHNVPNLEKIGYGKGYKEAREKFNALFTALDALVETKGMTIIVIGHAEIKKFDDPERDSYDRYNIKLDEKVAARFREWADYVFFVNYDTDVKVEKEGFQNKVKASSYGKRLMYSQRKPAYDAKARYAIPERLPLDWNTFAQADAEAKAKVLPKTAAA